MALPGYEFPEIDGVEFNRKVEALNKAQYAVIAFMGDKPPTGIKWYGELNENDRNRLTVLHDLQKAQRKTKNKTEIATWTQLIRSSVRIYRDDAWESEPHAICLTPKAWELYTNFEDARADLHELASEWKLSNLTKQEIETNKITPEDIVLQIQKFNQMLHRNRHTDINWKSIRRSNRMISDPLRGVSISWKRDNRVIKKKTRAEVETIIKDCRSKMDLEAWEVLNNDFQKDNSEYFAQVGRGSINQMIATLHLFNDKRPRRQVTLSGPLLINTPLNNDYVSITQLLDINQYMKRDSRIEDEPFLKKFNIFRYSEVTR